MYNKTMNKIVPENMRFKNLLAFFTKKDFDIKSFSHNKNLYFPIQRHTDNVLVIQDGISSQIADAVITAQKGLIIGVKVADCLPILIFDPEKYVIAAVHAGWRSTATAILKKTIKQMEHSFQTDPDKLLLAFGPSIRGCCYEVGQEVIAALKKETDSDDFIINLNGKKHVDLALANLCQALSCGVRAENIWISADCTYCKNEEYASYRFHKDKAARQYGLIGML